MENKVLVAYATKHGHTEEIAEKIGQVRISFSFRAFITPAWQNNRLLQWP